MEGKVLLVKLAVLHCYLDRSSRKGGSRFLISPLQASQLVRSAVSLLVVQQLLHGRHKRGVAGQAARTAAFHRRGALRPFLPHCEQC